MLTMKEVFSIMMIGIFVGAVVGLAAVGIEKVLG
jgi:hypothetical protein